MFSIELIQSHSKKTQSLIKTGLHRSMVYAHTHIGLNIKENLLQPSSLNINIKHGYLNNKPTQSILTLANSVLLNIIFTRCTVAADDANVACKRCLRWMEKGKQRCCCKHFLIGFRIKNQDLYEFILREIILKLKAIHFFGIVEFFFNDKYMIINSW